MKLTSINCIESFIQGLICKSDINQFIEENLCLEVEDRGNHYGISICIPVDESVYVNSDGFQCAEKVYSEPEQFKIFKSETTYKLRNYVDYVLEELSKLKIKL